MTIQRYTLVLGRWWLAGIEVLRWFDATREINQGRSDIYIGLEGKGKALAEISAQNCIPEVFQYHETTWKDGGDGVNKIVMILAVFCLV